MLLLRASALIALVAFAHIVSAQDAPEEVVKTEVKKQPEEAATHTEAVMPLKARYQGGSESQGGNEGGNNDDNNNSGDGGSSNNNDNNENNDNSGNSNNNNNNGGSNNNDNSDNNDSGSGSGSGSSSGSSSSGSGGSGGGGSDNADGGVSITNQVVTNKVIPGRTSVRPTRTSFSKSTRVVASTKRNTYRQNSESTVSQLNKVKQTNVHTHLAETIHRPLTVNTYKRHHHTQYIIKKQPYVTNVRVEQTQDRWQPAEKNVVIYTNSQSVSKSTLPTIVNNKSRYERLRTIWEAKRNLGTKNIGSALNEGAANIGSDSGSGGNGGGGRGDSSNNNNNNSGSGGHSSGGGKGRGGSSKGSSSKGDYQ